MGRHGDRPADETGAFVNADMRLAAIRRASLARFDAITQTLETAGGTRQQKRPGKPDLPLVALSSASTSVVKVYAMANIRAHQVHRER